MKSAFRAFLFACALLMVAAVMPPAVQGVVIGPASAGTYGDNFTRGRNGHTREVEVYRYRRLIGVRRVAGSAPMVQEQPARARCGGRCVTARPTCGTRCNVKPKCSTCRSVAAPRQTNTAKVSGIKSVVKGDGNTVTQTVTVNQTNVYGGGAAAVSTQSTNAVHRVVRCIGWRGDRFFFVDETGTTAFAGTEAKVGDNFAVIGGKIAWRP